MVSGGSSREGRWLAEPLAWLAGKAEGGGPSGTSLPPGAPSLQEPQHQAPIVLI